METLALARHHDAAAILQAKSTFAQSEAVTENVFDLGLYRADAAHYTALYVREFPTAASDVADIFSLRETALVKNITPDDYDPFGALGTIAGTGNRAAFAKLFAAFLAAVRAGPTPDPQDAGSVGGAAGELEQAAARASQLRPGLALDALAALTSTDRAEVLSGQMTWCSGGAQAMIGTESSGAAARATFAQLRRLCASVNEAALERSFTPALAPGVKLQHFDAVVTSYVNPPTRPGFLTLKTSKGESTFLMSSDFSVNGKLNECGQTENPFPPGQCEEWKGIVFGRTRVRVTYWVQLGPDLSDVDVARSIQSL